MMKPLFRVLAGTLSVWMLATIPMAFGQDWPMWRFDARRSAASPNALPAELSLLWERKFASRQQAWDDPLNLDLMTYDRLLEPIVLAGRLVVSFNDADKVVALETSTGAEAWTVFAEAPIRLPPAGGDGAVFFCSDDGYLYCVDVASGRLRWKFFGAPSHQQVIGNRRLISAWPARGGPVVRDQTVYFTASIWPFMGTFIHALDAETGTLRWSNDSTGAQYIQQPHSAPSFAGVAPQGALVATDELLIVPGGRSVPAVFDRNDGSLRYFEINAGGKGSGGSFVAADDRYFYVHTRQKGTRAFHLGDGVKTAFMPNEPVLHKGHVYSAETAADGTAIIRAYGSDDKPVWELQADGRGDLILAGNQLIAAGSDRISVIGLPQGDSPAHVEQVLEAAPGIERLLTADGKLFAVTLDGRILAYGPPSSVTASNVTTPTIDSAAALETEPTESSPSKSTPSGTAPTGHGESVVDDILASCDAQGYGFWFGRSDSPTVAAMARRSQLVQLAIVDSEGGAIDETRRRLDREQRYGRITVHPGDAVTFKAPKYVANLVVLDRDPDSQVRGDEIAALYESVRPFGGVLYAIEDEDPSGLAAEIQALRLEQAEVSVTRHGVIVRRQGALPGSADWTHQHGDVANTLKSNDARVRLPLGLLWFGGNSHLDVLPRHGHGPPEQVVGGRLFIQGINSLSARDVFTGRVLWKREFADLGTFDVYYDETYEEVPLDTKYNQVHIPGANARGTNYVVTEDSVYLVEGSRCHVLDPATGETRREIVMPQTRRSSSGGDSVRSFDDQTSVDGQTTPGSDDENQWGYIGVYKDVLIGGLGFADYRMRHGLAFEEDKELSKSKAGFGAKSVDRAASRALIGFDRHTGEVLWRFEANHSFWHNGIAAGGDQIYVLDRNPARVEQALMRRGQSRPDGYRIAALNYKTGELKWEIQEDIFGTWLSYSEEFDLVLQAGAAASDRLVDEISQGMAVHSAADGSLKWSQPSLKYSGPCMLHHEWIITNTNSNAESAGAFSLLDGRQKMIPNPITGQLQPWKLTRAYGCNSLIASENLLTFRSGAAGYYDLLSEAGTGNFGGFKSGCTSNLVVAGGVLNAPDYTRTCSCAYQNQTSLALVHMPDIELWSVDTTARTDVHGKRIDSLAVNFGAPGDRRDEAGRLWLEYPTVSGDSPPLDINFKGTPTFYQHHSSRIAGEPLAWVMSSGVEQVTEIRVAMKLRDQHQLSTGLPVAHVDDDAEEDETGKVSLDSSDLELVKDASNQKIGLRFPGIQLARDAVIRSAHLQFTCDEPSKEKTSLLIAAEASGNAERFRAENHDLSSRALTRAEVLWVPEPWAKAGEATEVQRTPDLSALLREVIARPDWKPGNSLAFMVNGTGKRTASAFRDNGAQAAALVVDADPGSVAATSTSSPEQSYRVRLVFGLPPQGEKRVFDVKVQGQLVRQDLHLSREPEARIDVRSDVAIEILEDVRIADELRIELIPKVGAPLLSGLELVRQEP